MHLVRQDPHVFQDLVQDGSLLKQDVATDGIPVVQLLTWPAHVTGNAVPALHRDDVVVIVVVVALMIIVPVVAAADAVRPVVVVGAAGLLHLDVTSLLLLQLMLTTDAVVLPSQRCYRWRSTPSKGGPLRAPVGARLGSLHAQKPSHPFAQEQSQLQTFSLSNTLISIRKCIPNQQLSRSRQ